MSNVVYGGQDAKVQFSFPCPVSSPCDNIDGEPTGAEIGSRYRGVNEELIIGAVFGRYITGTLDTGIPHPSQYITYSQDTRQKLEGVSLVTIT